MISERLRKHVPEFGPLSDSHLDVIEAADVIDALVAALEKSRWYVEAYDTREHNSDQDADLTQIDAALALARRK